MCGTSRACGESVPASIAQQPKGTRGRSLDVLLPADFAPEFRTLLQTSYDTLKAAGHQAAGHIEMWRRCAGGRTV